MTQQWIQMNKKADFYQLAEQFHIDPVIARVIRNRDIVEPAEYEQYLSKKPQFYSPLQMKHVEEAVEVLGQKIEEQAKLRIISDYDVDGVMSNYILLKGLRQVGAIVDYQVPDRMIDGYGINETMVQKAYEDGIDTIITCDNGIAAWEEIALAKQLGMTVIVTDHHDIPFEYEQDGSKRYILPPADMVINPKQLDCRYPFKQLCGAAVAYKLIQALFLYCDLEETAIEDFLEFVAIATVCDVMELRDENRTFVKLGLEELNRTSNYGLRALMKANDLGDKVIAAYHLGFILGPCINATGRLETAEQSLLLLLEDNADLAMERAMALKKLNQDRKDMTADGVQAAIDQIEELGYEKDKVLVIFLPDCHESLAGIIAGRLREQYYRPTFVVTRSKGDILKGSSRSIEEYNMYEALKECEELLLQYGGHPMAAGFSLKEKDLEYFRHKLNILCELTPEQLSPKLYIDVPMPIDYINFGLIEQLNLLEPYGKGNEKPVFAQRNLKVNSAKILGKNQNVLKLTFEAETGANMEGIYFEPQKFLQDIAEWFGKDECDQMLQGWLNDVRLDIAYYPAINEFNGLRAMQIVVKSYLPYKEA